MTGGGAALELDEAVPLGYAMGMRVMADQGIRALAIKGEVLVTQGLRGARPSVDVDILVDPGRFTPASEALAALGWVEDGPHEAPSVMPRHSTTFRHLLWPCEIDLHAYFPGFLADPAVVFEELWATREQVTVAAIVVDCPGRMAHAALAALHCLRDVNDRAKADELDDLVARVKATADPGDLVRLQELAVATDSAATLEPFLSALGVDVPADAHSQGEALREWTLRSHTRTTASLAWLEELRRTRWRSKPRVIRLALWPTRAEMQKNYPDIAHDDRAIMDMRIQRLRRGLRQLPKAAREIRDADS